MAKIKLTKSAVDSAQAQAQPVEPRDTLVPGFLCKITPAGRKVFMLKYRTNVGERPKPALRLYGELTVEQTRSLAQEWLAQVRRGGDPAGTPSGRVLFPACVAGRNSGSRGRIRTGARHPAGEVEKRRHCQRG